MTNSYKPLTVLFLSTGNGARSILAEALLREKGGDKFVARSAGLKPLTAIPAETMQLLTTHGIFTDGLHTKGWSEFLASAHIFRIDVIVTLSPEAQAQCPKWPGAPVRVHWPVDDPLSAEKPDVMEWKYMKCFGTLEARIAKLVKTNIATTPDRLLLQFKDIGMAV